MNISSKAKKKGILIGILALVLSLFLALSGSYGAYVAAAKVATDTAFELDEGLEKGDYDGPNGTRTAAKEVNADIAAEGLVLLKNENKALPLSPGNRVSLFGKGIHDIYYGGSGSSSTGGIDGQQFMSYYAKGAGGEQINNTEDTGELQKAGLVVNQELSNFYTDPERSGLQRARPGMSAPANHSQYETAINEKSTQVAGQTQTLDADPTAIKSIEGAGGWRPSPYRDAAIMSVGRFAAEGWDIFRRFTESNNASWGAEAPKHHGLELEPQEIELMEYIKKPAAEGGLGFGKLIVLVNTGTVMELGPILQYADAVLWYGFPGANGLESVAKALVGEVNPSGGLVDTWNKDMLEVPAVKDFGDNTRVNDDGTGALTEAAFAYKAGGASGVQNGNGIRYQEGIYVGYRYFETRGFVEKQKAATSTWYEDKVHFPLGYGESYTSFEWALEDGTVANNYAVKKDDTLTFNVKVTNTGDVAGKDTVELYFNAPYFNGGIEKSHVVLGGYAKTKLLAPGASEVVTIKMLAREMASYDYSDANGNGFKGYELEAGDYKIYLAKNAHAAWADSTTLTRTVKVANNNDITKPATATKGANGFAYKTSKNTNYEIKNQFDDVSFGWGWTYAGDAEKGIAAGTFKKMSRADFEGTYPITPTDIAYRTVADSEVTSRPGTQNINPTGSNTPGYDIANDKYGGGNAPWYSATKPKQSEENYVKQDKDTVVLADLTTTPKTDPKWDKFMDQFSVAQLGNMMAGFYMVGGKNAPQSEVNAPPALGMSLVWQPDGPTGITGTGSSGIGNGGNGVSGKTLYWASPIVVASTWNDELAEKQGKAIANEALSVGMNGIYAPAANTHRTPFSGRNFEYYSEDGFIGGQMAAAVIKGMQSLGLIPALKHFAFNDQETGRTGLATWFDEQAGREIYLKQFQASVEDAGCLGVMSAFNRIGATGQAASYELLTNVLRNEWGFEGYVVTDYGSRNIQPGIRVGNDMALNNYTMPATIENWDTNTHVAAMRKASKNILFAVSRSNAVLRSNAGTTQYVNRLTSFVGDVSSTMAEFNLPGGSKNGFRQENLTYKVADGSKLPDGYVLNEKTGIITGPAIKSAFGVKIDSIYNISSGTVAGSYRYATYEYKFTATNDTVGTWIPGTGAPSAELGFVGDTYIDKTTGDIYEKNETGWAKTGSIKGEDGTPGAPGAAGKDAEGGCGSSVSLQSIGLWTILAGIFVAGTIFMRKRRKEN